MGSRWRAVILLCLLGQLAVTTTLGAKRPKASDALAYAADITFERYGPRYPQKDYALTLINHAYVLDGKRPSRKYARPGPAALTPQEEEDADAEMCFRGFVVTTVASPHAMRVLVPQLLLSLRAHAYPNTTRGAHGGDDAGSGASASTGITMDHHAVIFGLNKEAHRYCLELQLQYHHACQFEDDPIVPAFSENEAHAGQMAFFALGFNKLKHILDVLSAGVDVLYVDADVILLGDPRVMVEALEADIVAGPTPPCGPGSRGGAAGASSAQGGSSSDAAGGESRQGRTLAAASDASAAFQEAQQYASASAQPGFNALTGGVPYDTSALYLAAKASVTRCLQRTLNDMKSRTHNATLRAVLGQVWEADSFARAVPPCAHTFGVMVGHWPDKVRHRGGGCLGLWSAGEGGLQARARARVSVRVLADLAHMWRCPHPPGAFHATSTTPATPCHPMRGPCVCAVHACRRMQPSAIRAPAVRTPTPHAAR